MPEMDTGATALKEPPDDAPAQASTRTEPCTPGRHSDDKPPTRPPAHRSRTRALPREGPHMQKTWFPGQTSLTCDGVRFWAVPALGGRSCGVRRRWEPGQQHGCGGSVPGTTGRRRPLGGERGLAVDAMVIGCLVMDRRWRRFLGLFDRNKTSFVSPFHVCRCSPHRRPVREDGSGSVSAHLSSLVKPSSFKENHKTEKTGDSSHTNPPLACNTQQYAAQITLIQNTNMHLGAITGPRSFQPSLHPSWTTPPCPWNPRWCGLACCR